MENRLRNHIDILFSNMPQNQNTQEIKEEMLQNLIEKYYDLLAEGKNEETAYSITIASIGDISSLFEKESPIDPQVIQKQKNKSALLTSIAIMLYILCVVPCIIFSMSGNVMLNSVLGPVLMFVMIAAATGLLIYNSKTKIKSNHNRETMVDEFKQWQSGNPSQAGKYKSIKGVLWSVTVLIYLLVSFLTFAWYITWIIFIIAVAVEQVIKLIIEIKN